MASSSSTKQVSDLEGRLAALREDVDHKVAIIKVLRGLSSEETTSSSPGDRQAKEEMATGQAETNGQVPSSSRDSHQTENANDEESTRQAEAGGDTNVLYDSSAKKIETGNTEGTKRRFRGKRGTTGTLTASITEKKPVSRHLDFEMPRDLVENADLDDAVARTLPKNYNFEIKKTLWRMRRCNAKRVAIQLPEGLLLFACPISDLLERFGQVEVFVFADVTYGACCVDDFAARALGCELLVHYGHSCLVPVDVTSKSPSEQDTATTQVMYVFVDVSFDMEHMVDSIKLEFPDRATRLAILGTIQFSGTLHLAKTELDKFYERPVLVPQARPLSSGEVLGCTSPSLPQHELDAFIFVADGRFHLESAMIANPSIPAIRYDPYSKAFTKEAYDSPALLSTRLRDINRARGAESWGIILGTLGRQGNPLILRRILTAIKKSHPNAQVAVILLSELSASKLSAMENQVQVWVQIACPRLSIDWAEAFSRKPLLTPYECFVALGTVEWRDKSYPQDFYARGSGPWTNYFDDPKAVAQ